MSRIFDALQRSGTEQSGVEYPDLISVVTEVFERGKKAAAQVAGEPVSSVGAASVEAAPAEPSSAELAVSEQRLTEGSVAEPSEFPVLNISVPPTSRLVFLTSPDSLAAEKFRFLGVRLRQLQQSRSLKRVLITSTIPEEGKSLVSANLAGVLARRKQRVLLIEGDLRRPTLAQQFGLGHLAGLGEWLQGDGRKLTNLYRLEGPDFWLMPAGDPPANPLELMQSGKLSRLMEQLASMFDWILVDSPPLLPLADTTVWARLTEGTLLVAREGKTEKAMLQRGLEVIKKSELLGVVLNSTHANNKNYYQRYSPRTK
jgi:capsular exopolysaccharide synthesis family protein